MAAESEDGEPEESVASQEPATPDRNAPISASKNADVEPETEKEDNEDEEEEPKLKYTRLTGNLGSVYRGGDATSSFMVAGDKMILGTHNGNIHVLSIPTFQSLRSYRGHSASITAVSVSPFPSPLPGSRPDLLSRPTAEVPTTPSKPVSTSASATTSPRAPRQPPVVPATPSNSIYIATSSIDGHVCVQSLVDHKDVMLRNFARPVQSVALSPEYKNDRSYLSGGLAGSLILTVGGRAGVSANANTNSAAAAASGWLGAIGLGSNTGKDTILHSGEGSISTIKWSLSGKFVVWVNEQGIKIMRSNIKLDNVDVESAWKRIAHVDRPNRRGWEEMASVWKARAEWIDDKNLESDDIETSVPNGSHSQPGTETPKGQNGAGSNTPRRKRKRPEKLVVGWGDTAWVLHVNPGGAGVGKDVGERSVGGADIVHILRFDDCIVSGLSLYTPSLLAVLAYRTRDDNNNPVVPASQTTPRRGIHHRQNGLPPELRLIDVVTKDEVDVDTLEVSRFESLSAADYHLSTLFIPPVQIPEPVRRGTLEAIGGGLWDVGANATRIFSSGASIISLPNSGDKTSTPPGSTSVGKATITAKRGQEAHPAATSTGLKIFIQSPYDCVLAVKRDPADHLTWLLEHQKYEAAWELIDEHPEVISFSFERQPDEPPSTPSQRRASLADFFADDSTTQATESGSRTHNSAVEKEKRRIGDLWVQQLVSIGDWSAAGKVAGRVLGTSSRWEHWVWTFAQAGHFDEITPYIPRKQLQPPLPSLVYEVVLGHYLINDKVRFKELLDKWDPDLFDIGSVTAAIEGKLKSGDVGEDTIEDGEQGRDWRILLEALAKLYVADGRPKEALRCYIRLQNADAAMALIRDYHLVGAVADDIPGFLLLRISREQMQSAPLAELEEASSEAVHLLVDEAYQGIVRPQVVVDQLQHKGPSFQPFLFFYLRALWKGEGTDTGIGTVGRIAMEGKSLVGDFGDLAVELFAEYDRPLLMEFLKSSESYALGHASSVCETRQYIPELVYLLSKQGQTRRALFLIIDNLADVSLAISFAKEQDDPDLWNDLLDYSMDKPRFIRGLLNEVGTAINPLTLVRRIPEGLEIEGLRDGIHRMVREYEIQFSISEGVAKVLRGEVAAGMDALRAGQNKGLRFEVVRDESSEVEVYVEPVVDANNVPVQLAEQTADAEEEVRPGHCVGCRKAFVEDEKETLIGFACGHVYHLSCLLSITSDDSNAAAAERLQAQLAADADDTGYSSRSVGAKVAHAHIIRKAIKGGCPVCGKVVDV